MLFNNFIIEIIIPLNVALSIQKAIPYQLPASVWAGLSNSQNLYKILTSSKTVDPLTIIKTLQDLVFPVPLNSEA